MTDTEKKFEFSHHLYTVAIPASWVAPLFRLSMREHTTPEQVIVGALGEELSRQEENDHE